MLVGARLIDGLLSDFFSCRAAVLPTSLDGWLALTAVANFDSGMP